MAKVAGLKLQPSKCVIVPLVPWSRGVESYVKRWVCANLPACRFFKVQLAGLYLGFVLGHKAGGSQWDSVVSGAEKRVSIISSSGSPPSVSVNSYNVRVCSMFSYKSQLLGPCPSLSKLEPKWSCNVLKSPWGLFLKVRLSGVLIFLFVRVSSIFLQSVCSCIRASWVTVDSWKGWLAFLEGESSKWDGLSMADWHSGVWAPEFWDSVAIVHNL